MTLYGNFLKYFTILMIFGPYMLSKAWQVCKHTWFLIQYRKYLSIKAHSSRYSGSCYYKCPLTSCLLLFKSNSKQIILELAQFPHSLSQSRVYAQSYLTMPADEEHSTHDYHDSELLYALCLFIHV